MLDLEFPVFRTSRASDDRVGLPSRSLISPSILVVFLGWIIGTSSCLAEVFEVGPGRAFPSPSDVPWESLSAGDTVRIHWREQPYRDKWVICRQGTAEDPITISGVPGPGGERPVIEGTNAQTRLALDYWNEPRGIIKIGGASNPPNTMPSHIIIEGLEIRSARPAFDFTDDRGNTQTYSGNAAAIFIEKGESITIRNCIMHDCGNGLFIASSTSEVMVEGNHLFDNGISGSIFEHNSYTEASGITFQFNRYGPLREGAGGNNLKDRSAGSVIRYNWIEGGNRQLDLVDSGSPSLRQESRYRETFVYGNILIETDNSGNRQVIHYGGDSGNASLYRKGKLHLYHNTIISTRSGRTTLLRLSTDDESADCRNNLIFVTETGNQLELLSSAGNLDLANNWIKPGWVDSFSSSATATVNGSTTFINGLDPGFLDFNQENFRLASSSPVVGAGVDLHPDTIPIHTPLREYQSHLHGRDRRPLGTPDLGAFAFSPFAEWQHDEFGPQAMNHEISGEDADPDGDLHNNLMEFAFMRNPQVPDSTSLVQPRLITIGESRFFSIELQRRPPPTGLLYRTEVSDDLLTWRPASSFSDQFPVNQTQETTDASTPGTTVIRLINGVLLSPSKFMRVTVEYQ